MILILIPIFRLLENTLNQVNLEYAGIVNAKKMQLQLFIKFDNRFKLIWIGPELTVWAYQI